MLGALYLMLKPHVFAVLTMTNGLSITQVQLPAVFGGSKECIAFRAPICFWVGLGRLSDITTARTEAFQGLMSIPQDLILHSAEVLWSGSFGCLFCLCSRLNRVTQTPV